MAHALHDRLSMQDLTTSQSSTFESIHDDHLDSVNGGCHNKGGCGGGGGGAAAAAAGGAGSCCTGGGFAFSFNFGGMMNMMNSMAMGQQGGQAAMGPSQFGGQGGMGGMGRRFRGGQGGMGGMGDTTVETTVGLGDSSQGQMQA